MQQKTPLTKFFWKGTYITDKRLVSELQKQLLFYKSLRKKQTAQLTKGQKILTVVNRWENMNS